MAGCQQGHYLPRPLAPPGQDLVRSWMRTAPGDRPGRGTRLGCERPYPRFSGGRVR
jgi:hypothetical protein